MFTFNKFDRIMKLAYYNGWLSKEMYLRISNIYKYNGVLTCELCKRPINNNNDNLKFSIDHIISQCEGGNSTIENLRVAHRLCNIKRENKFNRIPFKKEEVMK